MKVTVSVKPKAKTLMTTLARSIKKWSCVLPNEALRQVIYGTATRTCNSEL